MPRIIPNIGDPGVILAEQFREGLMLCPGNVIITIRAKTVPEMRKTNNPYFGRVHKISLANGTIGADYEKAVNRKLEKQGEEPDFVAGPRPWGETINKALVQLRDKYYIRFIEKHRKEYWFLDDYPCSKDMFTAFLPKKKEEIITYRNFTVDNILCIKWRGRTMRIAHAR